MSHEMPEPRPEPSLLESAAFLDDLDGELDNTVPSSQPINPRAAIEVEAATSTANESETPDGITWWPGPGEVETLFWWLGFLAIHLGISVVIVVVWTVLAFFPESGVPRFEISATSWHLVAVAGIEQVATILFAGLAVGIRFLPNPARALNFTPPPLFHTLLILLMVIPAGIVTGRIYSLLNVVWKFAISHQPWLAAFDNLNSVEAVKGMADNAPLWCLVLIIGCGPAIGEELIFRGAIGRGLLPRLGLWGGILATSILFGLAHLHPVHSLAVIPMGMLLHWVYVTSRSFWAPMLYHFANNSWAVCAMEIGETVEGDADEWSLNSTLLLLTAFAALATTLVTLWRTRVVYRQHDDAGNETVVDPSPLELAVPEALRGIPRSHFQLRHRSLAWWLIAIAIFYGLLSILLATDSAAELWK